MPAARYFAVALVARLAPSERRHSPGGAALTCSHAYNKSTL